MTEDELDHLVGKLDLEQKVRLLSGVTVWRTQAEPDIGLRALVVSDGPVGVRGDGWDERSTSCTLPSPTALAATWDEDLVRALGGLLAAEARRKGVDVLLAPTLNLHRSPLGGRHFECYSEDPLLTGRIGAAFVRGVQSGGVAATAKHYVGNESETERLTLDARIDERTLREVYLAPFEAALDAGVWCVMSAYNRVNGVSMSESPLLAEPLKGEWGFDGLVVSDWGGVRSTLASARAAQDLAMPGPNPWWGAPLLAAVRAGEVPVEAIDDKVKRLLRLAFRVGALTLGDPPADAAPAGPAPVRSTSAAAAPAGSAGLSGAWTGQDAGGSGGPSAAWTGRDGSTHRAGEESAHPVGEESARPAGEGSARRAGEGGAGAGVVSGSGDGGPGGPGAERTLLRRAVAAGTVLLRNEGGLLPLDPGGLRRVALIGPNAAQARIQGGGSAGVYARDVVSPLDGLRAALAGVAEVSHAAGVSISDLPTPLEPGVARDPRSGEPGVLLRVLDSGGAEQVAEHRLCGRLLEPAVTGSSAVIEISAVFRPGRDGDWRLSVGGWGPITLTVDGRTVLDEVVPRDTDDPATVNLYPPYRTATVPLTEGREVLLVARRRYEPDSGRVLSLAADPPPPDPVAGFDAAVRLAGECDVAVVVVGTSEEIESEGFDRAGLALPGRQDELVRAVAAANPRTVVIVNSGGPVALPWRDRVPAVLLSWFPGQEAGNGLADVLLGVREPGGRLPTTWSDAAVIPAAAVDGVLDYSEGPDIGYRAWAKRAEGPAYWFGHGLGYTTWAYEGVSVPERVAPGGAFTVRVRVRNTGARAGREVVQVYLARPGDDGPRLAGFAAAEAAAGEAAEVEVELGARAMRHWATEHHEWRVAPGVYTVLAGHDFGHLPLAASMRCGEAG